MGQTVRRPLRFAPRPRRRRPRLARAAALPARRRLDAADGETVPDPQDPDTFRRSWLDGRGDPATWRFYADLIRARATIPRVAADIAFDEGARWLRVVRGDAVYAIVYNAGRTTIRRVPTNGGAWTDVEYMMERLKP